MLDLITIGDSTLDTFLILDEKSDASKLTKDKKLVCFNYAQKIPITNTAQSVGGNAANVAVGTKKLGHTSAIVTELDDDINGHIIKSELEESKVSTKMVKIIRNEETRYSIVLNYKSERTILSYHAKRNYILPKLPQTKWIYYTSLGKTFEKVQTKLEGHLKKNPNIKLAMNPGSYQFSKGLSKIKKILPHADILFVNKEEAIKLVGKKKSIKGLFSSLHKMGAKEVIITDSTNGSYASNGVEKLFMRTYAIPALARTGAGDAYTSGYLSATMYGKSMSEAMQWGTANAGGVIQAFGAQKGLLSKAKLENIIKKHKQIKPRKM